jgi:hypothetical protein
MRAYQADVARRRQKREAAARRYDMEFTVRDFTVRQFRDDEAAPYRDIRLEALRLHPEAFGSAFEQEALQPLSAS